MNFRILIFIPFFMLLVVCSSCTQSQTYLRKGQQMERAGNYTGAITNYTKAIESKGFWDQDWPALDELPLEIARDKYLAGDYAGAVAEYDNYTQHHPYLGKGLIKSGAAEVYIERGEAQYAQHNYHDAIADYSQALQLRPKDTETLYLRAQAHCKLKDFSEAAADYDAGLTNHHINAEAYIRRAVIKNEAEDYAGVIKDLDVAIEFDPKNVNAYYFRAFVKWSTKDRTAALADFTTAVALHPEYPRPVLFRGAVKAELHDYPAAIIDFSKAIQIAPRFADAYEMRGVAFYRQFDFKAALADFNKVASLSPTNAWVYCECAKAMIRLTNYSGAASNLNRALKCASSSARIFVGVGWCYRQMGNLAAARTNFEQAIQLGTNDVSSLIGLGCLQADQLQFPAALEAFQTAEKLDPSWVYAWYHAYFIRFRLGQDKAARAELSDYMKSAGVIDNDWSSKIGNYLAGNLSENDLLKIASDSSINMAMRQEQLCEAYYYTGMQNLLAGNKSKAADLFRQCLNTDEKDFMEYAGAEAELDRLKNWFLY